MQDPKEVHLDDNLRAELVGGVFSSGLLDSCIQTIFGVGLEALSPLAHLLGSLKWLHAPVDLLVKYA